MHIILTCSEKLLVVALVAQQVSWPSNWSLWVQIQRWKFIFIKSIEKGVALTYFQGKH